jgi:hypothetical protein
MARGSLGSWLGGPLLLVASLVIVLGAAEAVCRLLPDTVLGFSYDPETRLF